MMNDVSSRLTVAVADRYSIERELGAGGMATVYLARDLKHERKVAIKVLRLELAAALGSDRFLREIRITANLNHPHILPLLDSGEADGFLYYVMPYVEGESLRDRISREKQLPVEDAMKIAAEVSDALGHAHSHDVIHRDIKPENILLQEGHAVVADFGIAHAVWAAGSERLTETGIVVGTPAYLSPEQAAGDREIDGRSDVYALGCVLYEMLAGEPPITGPTVPALLSRKATEPPPSVTSVRKTVPPELERTINRALALVPADRQRSAAELSQELTAVPTARVTVAKRNGWRFLAAIASLAALALITTALVLVWNALVSDTAALDAEAAGRVIVLPYDNETGNASLDPVGRMMAEWITEGLAQTGEVQVIPNLMVLQSLAQASAGTEQVGTATLVRDVARLNQSGIAVTGSYYSRGAEIEFHSEVTDVLSGESMGVVQPVRADSGDFASAMESVRDQVMGVLATRLGRRSRWEVPRSVQPPTYEAYRFYARGGEEWTNGNYRAAAEWFERAYHADTTYLRSLMVAAAAWGNAGHPEKSDSILQLVQPRRLELAPYDRHRLDVGIAGFRGDVAARIRAARAGSELVPVGTMRTALVLALIAVNRPREALQEFEAMWEATVDLEWFVLWGVYTEMLHLLGDYERELEIALQGREQLQGSLHTMTYHGRALAALGRTDELRSLVNDILLIAPQPGATAGSVLQWIAGELRRHGQRELALELLDRTLTWWDEQPPEYKSSLAGRRLLGQLSYQREDWDAAAGIFEALAQQADALPDALGARGAVAARRGDTELALSISRELADLELPYLLGRHTLWRARIAALLGERDEAIDLLRRAFSEGVGHGILLHADMDLEPLRDYPPFEELMRPKG
ncbi:MAG: protein kinase [Gemmatimonadota bacterium]|nr:MAG: protein kinase [Gemmatimonadota bacterium]